MTEKNAQRIRKTLPLFFIIILGLLVYFNSLSGAFVWDDFALIRDNMYIKDASFIKEVLTQDIGAGSFVRYNYYRPVQLLTYMSDYAFWGLNPFGYHLTNIILHISCGILLYWLLNILFSLPRVSFLAALLFVIFPTQTEAVSYIAGRADSLFALFTFLSLIFYVKAHYSPKKSYFFLAIISYILSALCKESYFILPFLLLLYHYTFRRKVKIFPFLTIIGICLLLIFLRASLLSALLYNGLHSLAILKRVPGFFVAVTNYLKILILPFNLHVDYGNFMFSFKDPSAVMGLALTFLLLIVAFIKRRSNRLFFFSVFWFFLTLLPASSIYPVAAFYMAEHWLYLPSIGFFLILAYGLNSLFVRKILRPVFFILVISLVLFYSLLTIRQNIYWRNEISLFERSLKFNPYSLVVCNNICQAYLEAGDKEKALFMCERAIDIDPFYEPAYCNLGNVYRSFGRGADALKVYQLAIALQPDYEYAHKIKGDLYLSINKLDAAVFSYRKALVINPRYADAYFGLANVYFKSKDKKEAIAALNQALSIDPGNKNSRQYRKTLDFFEKSLRNIDTFDDTP